MKVSYIYDGDTFKLADGRKIRLVGINTPELGHDDRADEPGAEMARQQLKAILSASQNQVRLKLGREQQDRYKRYLAHPYNLAGKNITELLLQEGAGYAITIPPNQQNLACYQEAETSARAAGLGVWKNGPSVRDASKMDAQVEGFYLIRGQIERIGKSRRALWLNLRQGPAIRIDWTDWDNFKGWNPDDFPGRRLEARGWIYLHKGQQRMQVRHPAAIQWLD